MSSIKAFVATVAILLCASIDSWGQDFPHRTLIAVDLVSGQPKFLAVFMSEYDCLIVADRLNHWADAEPRTPVHYSCKVTA
jgi:hypothetical protein